MIATGLFSLAARIFPPLRRVVAENERLARENAALRDEARRTSVQAFWVRHHPYTALGETPGRTVRVDAPDRAIVERIIAAYRRNATSANYGEDSMWRVIHDEKQRGVDLLLREGGFEDIAKEIRNPIQNYLLRGFETINRDSCARFANDLPLQRERADRFKDALVRLGEALGALRVENPEGGPWLDNVHLPAETVIDMIEARLGIELAVPWFYDGFYGLQTRRGVFGHRMINAAYCAWRIRHLAAGKAQPRVLEIGAGLGHLARYAYLMGIRDYTIIDLPLTNVSQGYFLMRTLGEDAVALEGEACADQADCIKVLTPGQLEQVGGRYDLVVNVDSMTEFGRAVATRYMQQIFACSDVLLSINHEANPFTVNELVMKSFPQFSVQRFPYWIRNGYVEEIIRRF